MKRVCLLIALVSFPTAAHAQKHSADPSLCEGELEAIRRDHKRLRAEHTAMEAELETRPTKKVHDKLVAAHEALRTRFKNAPKEAAYARVAGDLKKAEAEVARLSARPTERDVAKWRSRAEAAEAELKTRPSADANARLQAQVDELREKLRASNGSVESSEGYDKVRWGMKPHAVKRKYDNLEDSGGSLFYRTEIAARAAVVRFFFAKEQLARVVVDLAIKGDDAVVVFNYAGKLLAKKYGAPKQRDKQWSNDRHKNDKAKWNTAVRDGELVLTATWETDDTRVALTGRGSNGEAQVVIRYTSKQLAPLIEVENEQKLLRGL